MGGDLNLKKSWHPILLKNQRRVYDEEHKALDERRQIDRLLKERAEERRHEELLRLQEEAGGPRRQQRVEWMYSGGGGGDGQRPADEMEAFLLGKRRVDVLLKDNEAKQLQKSAEMSFENPGANNARDIASKVSSDPLLMIKKQEQSSLESIMKDPAKRRQFMKSHGMESNDPERERERDSDRKHEHKRRRERSRSRSRSPRRSKHRSDRERNRSRSPRRSNGHKSQYAARPPREERRHRERSRSPRGERRHRSRSREDRRRNRSASPRGERRYRSRSPKEERRRENRYERRPGREFQRGDAPRERRGPPAPQRREDDPEEQARRLAAMQADASQLENDRRQRVANAVKEDESELLKEEKLRARKGGFAGGLHHQGEDSMDLGERLKRSRAGLERLEAY